VQATLTDFITHGHFTTHVRKIRQTYGARRELLRRMLAQTMPAGVTISKEESGLHLVVELPDHVDDVALAQRAAAMDISVKALSTYYLKPPQCGAACWSATPTARRNRSPTTAASWAPSSRRRCKHEEHALA
jgi:DNA-binding transcriptional MocR family regulator